MDRLWTMVDLAAPRRKVSRRAYFEATGTSLLGIALSFGTANAFQIHLPYLFGLGAVLAISLRYGFGPAATATVIGLMGLWYFGSASPMVTTYNSAAIAIFSFGIAVAGEAILKLRARADAYSWQLSQRKTYLQSVFDTSPAAMLVIANDDEILACNQAAAALFGYASRDLNGQSITQLVALKQKHRAIDELATAIARYRLSGELAIGVRRDGSLFDIALGMAEVNVDTGPLVTIYVRDETVTRQAALDLSELQIEVQQMGRATALGQLGAAIAHELNQPLASAANYAGAARRLLSDGRPISAVDGLISESLGQVLRASDILKRLRRFVDPEGYDAQWIHVRQIISEAVHLVQLPVRYNGVSLNIEIDPEVDYLMVDRIQIQQVLLNLIANAAQAVADCTERHLQLVVARSEGDFAMIALKDSGRGVPPAMRDRLFKPFSSNKPNGLGVGLAISRSIVEAHGGQIWLDETIERGSRFCFTLRHREAIEISNAA